MKLLLAMAASFCCICFFFMLSAFFWFLWFSFGHWTLAGLAAGCGVSTFILLVEFAKLRLTALL